MRLSSLKIAICPRWTQLRRAASCPKISGSWPKTIPTIVYLSDSGLLHHALSLRSLNKSDRQKSAKRIWPSGSMNVLNFRREKINLEISRVEQKPRGLFEKLGIWNSKAQGSTQIIVQNGRQKSQNEKSRTLDDLGMPKRWYMPIKTMMPKSQHRKSRTSNDLGMLYRASDDICH